jgi:hypothetical protein
MEPKGFAQSLGSHTWPFHLLKAVAALKSCGRSPDRATTGLQQKMTTKHQLSDGCGRSPDRATLLSPDKLDGCAGLQPGLQIPPPPTDHYPPSTKYGRNSKMSLLLDKTGHFVRIQRNREDGLQINPHNFLLYTAQRMIALVKELDTMAEEAPIKFVKYVNRPCGVG